MARCIWKWHEYAQIQPRIRDWLAFLQALSAYLALSTS
jgi:hypothetical protein